jgi:penicillin-binding protein 1B
VRRIVKLGGDMGITTPMPPYPSMALGAAAITPLELATVYATLASGGARPSVHSVVAVVDRYGKPVQGAPLPKPVRVISPVTAYLVTSLLEGVLQRGTAAGAAAGLSGDLAGKTGTTNKRRDSWFAGYAPERATVVWVGYDDNSRTRLSGARAALPVWIRFMGRVAPPGGYSTFRQPPGIATAVIDPTTGLLATESCPTLFTEVFRQGEVPTQVCNHGWGDPQFADLGGQPESDEETAVSTAEERTGERAEKRHTFRRWLRKVFGGRNGQQNEADREREQSAGQDGQPPP